MEYKVQQMKLSQLALNTGQIEGLPANPRQWTRDDIERIARSLKETPELFDLRPIIAVPNGKENVILAGSLRFCGAKENKDKTAPVIVLPADTSVQKMKEIVIKDNGSFGAWDMDSLANEWDDLPLKDWGAPKWDINESETEDLQKDEEAEIERKRREFTERMANGENLDEDAEYQEFLAKFEAKKTTDDCYTPAVVYEAVADWVAKEYGLSKANFVRPFYPGGDYQQEKYKDGDIVVDNPPFSILSEILKFYKERRVRFFLFAPHLTLFSSSSSSSTALPVGVAITYENGASVNTSFLTNLEDTSVRLRSCPSLYAAVKVANDANLKELHKELPRYSYDHHIITASFIGQLSRLGIDLVVPVAESEPISQLDSQKESGKAIFGKGYIIGNRVFAEREKAEREKVEREKAERWELSERELKIVAKLSK